MNAFDDGVLAAETGMEEDDNPHPPGTPAHGDWLAGYRSVLEAREATALDDE